MTQNLVLTYTEIIPLSRGCEIAQFFGRRTDNVAIVSLDWTEDHPDIPVVVNGYPRLIWVPFGDVSQAILYEGYHKPSLILEFIDTQVSMQ